MSAQVRAAEEAGFDGVTFSEHHLGYGGYFPNPLYAATLVLERTTRVWSGALPMVLTVRPPAIVAEDIAWLAATHPGRVAVAFGAGNAPAEQELYRSGGETLVERFQEGLRVIAGALSPGGTDELLSRDAAVEATRGTVPLLSAARSRAAAVRAAHLGMGLLMSPTITPERTKNLIEHYRQAGGTTSCVLIRRVWVEQGAQKSPFDHSFQPSGDNWFASGTAGALAEQLLSFAELTGADAYNLRIHAPGIEAGAVLGQIQSIGDELLPALKTGLEQLTHTS
jgi:alkanesulfonate monooxygenase SsuD/methylene tetrahydromethanopterin reductase-like flavin-dependent oxidoreductase (luciferase family)